jgi:hypothetical protein
MSGPTKASFKDRFNITGVNEETFKNEKFPELEDANYPQKLIQQLESQAKEADQQQKSNHADSPDPLRRQAHYQYRGPAYVHKHNGRERYQQWPFGYLFDGCDPATKQAMLEKVDKLTKQRPVWAIVKDQSKWEKRFKFPEAGSFPGKKKLFYLTAKVTSKSDPELYFFFTKSAPYSWVAHHLIPIEAFDSNNELRFTDKQQELIRLSGYDVNNGHNIVPLPTKEVPPHCLLAHVGNHLEYNKYALGQLDQARSDIDKAVESGEPHAAFYPTLLKMLTNIEDRLWQYLKKLGTSSVKLYLQGAKRPKSNLVKFITKGKNKHTGRRKLLPEGAMN